MRTMRTMWTNHKYDECHTDGVDHETNHEDHEGDEYHKDYVDHEDHEDDENQS